MKSLISLACFGAVVSLCAYGCGSDSSHRVESDEAGGDAGAAGARSDAGGAVAGNGDDNSAGMTESAGSGGAPGSAGSDAGSGGAESGGNGPIGPGGFGGVGGMGAGGEAGAAGACGVDSGADPFEGIWTIPGAETWTVSNRAGCSTWIGRAADTVCDSCVGNYEITEPGVATLMLTCTHEDACSVSPNHVDTGTLTRSGCSITYNYSFGTGSTMQSASWVSDTSEDICSASM